MDCPFCHLDPGQLVFASERVVAIRDHAPVSPGHTLVLLRRHVASFFDTTEAERAELWRAVAEVEAALERGPRRPDGYNVGFNDGAAAGQTVFHLHVHVIPRFAGDVEDPRGGVRHVVPSRGRPLLRQAMVVGGLSDPFLAALRPLIAAAAKIDVVAAFVQLSGLSRVEDSLRDALARGAELRLLTGDYLHITQAEALRMLLDWSATRERLRVRIVETERLPPGVPTFHAKSWRFESPQGGVLFVGSSNLSRAALGAGIEWNLRVDRAQDPEAFAKAEAEFERLWARARDLTSAWVDAYAARARQSPFVLPPGELNAEPLPEAHAPHPIQAEALAALSACRAEGRARALVVMATGLGKTWLAAFDLAQSAEALGRPPRLLFLAHREELLAQAARTFRTLARGRWPDVRVGWCLGSHAELDADWVFASVAKLGRPEHLARLEDQRFDYVVVDEVHHATAASYRRILDRLRPGFLLGLTATPDRADEADVRGLFDDNVAFRADIGLGIQSGRLVPFDYFGLRTWTWPSAPTSASASSRGAWCPSTTSA